jgi:PncC family amidohydrolase
MEKVESSRKGEVLAGALLSRAGLTLAVGESCTGGLLGSRLTDVAGSSSYFLGGVIAYHDSLKVQLLGVPPDVISEHGAVSAECALLMAQGVRRLSAADVGVAVTGIAGPSGGTAEKPVGTVYIALAAAGVERVEGFCWQGDRLDNKRRSVEAALEMLVEYLHGREAKMRPEERVRG